ncbi:hypothetical protein D6C87_06922 [Aureobasidium pullulans]|uniref:Uncharacterized protein n=1 Tax=Aureobasidium pullulans TaxID=5580 RepID=A0AB38LT95_AURPU|nr:hypothetical protein D6C94_06647 [Aureobasidium pullulans]THZ39700.1 hypothetical protein D6C87_06922 [Aureobasidium pullulans]
MSDAQQKISHADSTLVMVSFKDITGALGTILGYLGAEVAEESTFERLLWPQRYYNDLSPRVFFQLVFLMPSGGPLHRAALQTLSKFQENGLYLGKARGNMLGSAFYRRLDVSYFARTLGGEGNKAKESRNGFLVEISRLLKHGRAAEKNDTEKSTSAPGTSKRAHIPMHHIYLECYEGQRQMPKDVAIVSEDHLTWKCFIGVIASELTAVIAAVVAGVYTHSTWLSVYFILPLLFKLASFATSVRRESFKIAGERESRFDTIFELDDLNHGFVLIQGPDYAVRQFCRHYGHPIRGRDITANRLREVMSMALVYLFVGYFPAGLIALLWLDDDAQTLWLSYQLYVVFAMHVGRLLGLNGGGRTEEHIARLLRRRERVLLRSSTGPSISIYAETVWLENVGEGKKAISKTIAAHERCRKSVDGGIKDEIKVDASVADTLGTRRKL